ncbi:MAG: Leucyl-tRNA ligase LeuS [candidate division WS6 bacterium GW2011_GWF2_39_15]|uniref:Leucine--tRNA ligase n=1 Tax=candidate division WS6 bacterium GW2011_GWF2_39_15 TaxID=1619100 RepID=A0A0G0MTC3_9BACT|nr:MAG: Leucyl-tRNA ligase LeuS [candidate division WS6 bacterium GW2011_GWF2_39_15]
MSYNFKEIENKWREKWFSSDIYSAKDFDKRKKKYVLVEFPYPSGSGLHVGHAFSFTGGDVYARYQRMRGYNVLFPMGYDAFGLPTENYAIKVKRKPQEVTKENTAMFKDQMQKLGFSFDWNREVNTTDPGYYKWTQWIFIKLFEKGLAYKEEWPINWCPSCKIGLANEEVIDGKCERCGTQTQRRNISQWIVKITAYADRLIEGLKETAFIDKVKAAQINWIDRKEWIDITYPIDGVKETVTIATTRPDTNYGATFIVLAPEHELVEKLITGKINTSQDIKPIKEYVVKAKNKSELERQKEVTGRDKTGVFTGLYAVNHLTDMKMPIWITDFVLGTVGTGAVVGVPGHDIRDFEFAQQFKIPIIRVVVGKDGDTGEITKKEQVQEDEGTMINSGFLDGMDIRSATKRIMDYMEEKGWGKKTVRYHLRDWIFSRQHYWGEPIPMVHCEKCGWIPVPEDQLPIVLPEVEHYEPTDTGESPLAKIEEWVNTKCPNCGGDAKRETDTMPNWAGSDWYYVRYLDNKNDKAIADMDKMKYWLPVDIYIGGDEHNTLHLLYSRFIYQFLYDLGEVPTPEPYYQRISHGVILGSNNQRMSKSKGNVITPDEVADKVGVDAIRAYLMFIGPFEGTMAWNDNALMGVKRFTERLYKFFAENTATAGNKSSQEVNEILHRTTKYVTEGFEQFQYNTIVAKYMELLNFFEKTDPKNISKESYEIFIKLIAPIMPYLAEELWSIIGYEKTVHLEAWPEYNEQYLVSSVVEIPVQINGRLKGKITVVVDADEGQIKEVILKDENLGKLLESEQIRKIIYIKGKIANIIV